MVHAQREKRERLQEIEKRLKSKKQHDRSKFTSKLCMDYGLSVRKVDEYLSYFKDSKLIKLTEDRIILCI